MMCLPRKRAPATPFRAALIAPLGEISVLIILSTVSQPESINAIADNSKMGFKQDCDKSIMSPKK